MLSVRIHLHSLFFLILHLCLTSTSYALHTLTKNDFLNTSHYALRNETIGHSTLQYIDFGGIIEEAPAVNYPGIQTIKINQIFKPGTVFLGFGLPNVFVARINEQGEFVKFDAKSMWRKKSTITSTTRGVSQSGIFFVLHDLSKEQVQNIVDFAHANIGKKDITCVHANMKVLEETGFSSGEIPLSHFYFPTPLMLHLIQHGIQFEGKDMDYTIVKTSPLKISQFQRRMDLAVAGTPVRHAMKATVSEEYRQSAIELNRAVQQHNNKLFSGSPSIDTQSMGRAFLASISVVSNFGLILRKIWGSHNVYSLKFDKNQLNSPKVSDYFSHAPLKAFSTPNPSFLTRFKSSFLFSKPVVNTIYGQMQEGTYDTWIAESQIKQLIPVHTEENANKFNYVLTDNQLILSKLNVMFSGVDWVLSKHVLLSHYSDSVRCSGEFWQTPDGSFYINNNSGTYQPTEDDLQNSVLFFNSLFKTLHFSGVHHEA